MCTLLLASLNVLVKKNVIIVGLTTTKGYLTKIFEAENPNPTFGYSTKGTTTKIISQRALILAQPLRNTSQSKALISQTTWFTHQSTLVPSPNIETLKPS